MGMLLTAHISFSKLITKCHANTVYHILYLKHVGLFFLLSPTLLFFELETEQNITLESPDGAPVVILL